ncbi:olfactory receptor 6C74-like [Alligator mississippiensis]|uniref:olfactory receptor 6C74-like n=1 Tax=Alligator mississippiensis TaxID=8496 RepID=UPI000711C84A|nr:olfactory receptor 6C74-like [Alligator mississippiensis]
MTNSTTVVEFILLGLTDDHQLKILLFLVLLLILLLILTGNLVIVVITLVDHHLQTPMYFFLRNFAFLEGCFTLIIIPNFLYSLTTGIKAISFASCFLQSFFFFRFGTSVYFHLAVMSFDRYMAICNPLHYGTIMDSRVCLQLVLGCWLVSFLFFFPITILFSQLPFCGPNVIDHFYCDAAPLLQLSCMDTGFIEIISLIIAVITLLGTLTVNVVSYGCIISTILQIPSSTGKKKAFSTCSAHLLVVVILYGSSIFRYIRPAQRGGQASDKVISFFYAVVTQLFNLYIYALRNTQVKQALKDAGGRAFSKHLRCS